jgi:hypothetical protein
VKKDLFIWALGVNGEGSTLVGEALIKSALNIKKGKNIRIIISKSSLLHNKILQNDEIQFYKRKIIILPQFFRNYIIQCLIKSFLPINFFCQKLITIDEFPFLAHKNQILYFQQAGVLEGKSLRWILRRILYKILINKNLKIFTQTKQINKKLSKDFKIPKENLITKLHDI